MLFIQILAPVIDLKSKRDDEDIYPASESVAKPVPEKPPVIPSACSQLNIDYNLDIVDEYNPLFPNEYEKVIKGTMHFYSFSLSH